MPTQFDLANVIIADIAWPLAIPPEGPRAIQIALNFALDTTYIIDMTLLKEQRKISTLGTMHIDNNGGGGTMVVTYLVGSSEFYRYSVAINTGLIVPLPCYGSPKIQITYPAAQTRHFVFYNFVLPPTMWAG